MNILYIVNALYIVNIPDYKTTAAPVTRCGCSAHKISFRKQNAPFMPLLNGNVRRSENSPSRTAGIFPSFYHAPYFSQLTRPRPPQAALLSVFPFFPPVRFFPPSYAPYSAAVSFFLPAFDTPSAPYGLSSRYKSPASNTSATTVQTPNGTPKNRPPILYTIMDIT